MDAPGMLLGCRADERMVHPPVIHEAWQFLTACSGRFSALAVQRAYPHDTSRIFQHLSCQHILFPEQFLSS